MKWRIVVDVEVPPSTDASKAKDLFIANYPMKIVAIIPDMKSMPRGCRGCDFFLNVFDKGNILGRMSCNHPRNIQPHVRNFQRQKPLSEGWFPNPPAWCKKESD